MSSLSRSMYGWRSSDGVALKHETVCTLLDRQSIINRGWLLCCLFPGSLGISYVWWLTKSSLHRDKIPVWVDRRSASLLWKVARSWSDHLHIGAMSIVQYGIVVADFVTAFLIAKIYLACFVWQQIAGSCFYEYACGFQDVFTQRSSWEICYLEECLQWSHCLQHQTFLHQWHVYRGMSDKHCDVNAAA